MRLFRCSSDQPSRPLISVEFVILHYTVEDLQTTLDLFSDPQSCVSAHLVLSTEGETHELVPCWEGRCRQADHAGKSRWREDGINWTGLNKCSIGIELVNRNGNLFPYTDEQYVALIACLQHLKSVFPALQDPRRLLGHEHIAGWRGKVDPGACFDWRRVFQEAYPGRSAPMRPAICPPDLQAALEVLRAGEPHQHADAARFWRAINGFLEAYVARLEIPSLT